MLLLCSADDSESWLMRGEYEMELCSAAEAAGNLAGALSHVNKAVGMYIQQHSSIIAGQRCDVFFLPLQTYVTLPCIGDK